MTRKRIQEKDYKELRCQNKRESFAMVVVQQMPKKEKSGPERGRIICVFSRGLETFKYLC